MLQGSRSIPSIAWQQQPPVLTGDLVTVREVVLGDSQSLYELLAKDRRVSQFISAPPPSVEAFQGFVNWSHRQRAAGQGLCFAVVPRKSAQPIGIFQVRALDSSFSLAEWGFALGSEFWSTGIFQDAARFVADFAFATMKTHRLEGRAASANGRGNGALQKIGATGEALLNRSFKRDGAYHDQFLWALIADEWRDQQIVKPARFSRAELQARIRCAMAHRAADPSRPPAPIDTRDAFPFFVAGHPNSPAAVLTA